MQNAIQKMIVETGRASNVVRRLRDFFRSGAMQLEIIEVGEIVAAIVEQFAAKFAQHEVELKVLPIPSVSLRADRLQIELVMRNLLANSLDEVVKQAPGRRQITLAIEKLPGERVRITVEDSGSGITSKTATHLFEPFTSTKSSGLGLGLVLSRAIVEAHGGSLWAEVAEHGIFRFVLPVFELGE